MPSALRESSILALLVVFFSRHLHLVCHSQSVKKNTCSPLSLPPFAFLPVLPVGFAYCVSRYQRAKFLRFVLERYLESSGGQLMGLVGGARRWTESAREWSGVVRDEVRVVEEVAGCCACGGGG